MLASSGSFFSGLNRLSPSLHISNRGTAASHTPVGNEGDDGAAACYPHEDEHLDAHFRVDVQFRLSLGGILKDEADDTANDGGTDRQRHG